MSEQPWSSDLSFVILNPTTPQMLALSTTDGWRLPRIQLGRRVWLAEVAELIETLHRETGLRTVVLRGLYLRTDDEARNQTGIYLAEDLDEGSQMPPGARWIARAELGLLRGVPQEAFPALEARLVEAETSQIPALRPPWARPGWFKRASDWMQRELVQHGYTLTAPIEQFRSWGISCILKARTASGDFYFKVASQRPLFGNEPQVTRGLAAIFPGHIPAPLSIEPDERWMILPDVGASLRERGEAGHWEAMVSLYGKMQRESVAHDLLAMGCLDRRLDRLLTQVDSLMADSARWNGLSPDEVRTFVGLGPSLKAMCRRLGEFGVPAALNHGDLHAGNLAVTSGKIIIFDWTDACLSHPFLDLALLLQEASDEARPALLDRYLAHWTDYEPVERLHEAWTLAVALSGLHQAVSYQHIKAALEPSLTAEHDGGLAYVIRIVLRAYKEMPHAFTD